jgi:tRNA A58 N-methylase Trm61
VSDKDRTRNPPAETPPPVLDLPTITYPVSIDIHTLSYPIMSAYAANLTNHNPSDYSQNASFVYSAKYTNAVLGLLDAKPGERIIDLGCGTAELSRQIKEAVGSDGFVAGVDSSEEMVCPILECELMVAGQS